jgi:uncharacterized protein YcgI (DUF1989 family)
MMKLLEEFVIAKCSSKAFVVRNGQILRVIAHEGRQVADIRFLNAHDYKEQFAARWSIPMNSIEGIGGYKKLTKLWSKVPYDNVMLTVIDDKVGDHNFGCQCAPVMVALKGAKGTLTCADLFDRCLKPHNLSMRDLDSAGVFNAFMPVRYVDDENGTFKFCPPSCKKGDHIDFRAEMDVLVAATSCPEANIVNDHAPKAMKYQIYEP